MHLDTSFLIDLHKEVRHGVAGSCHRFLKKHGMQRCKTSVVAMMEYLEGYSEATLPDGLQFLEAFELVGIGKEIALTASRIRRDLRQTGTLLPDADILIAACAVEQEEVLVTNNYRHFERVSGLRLVDYKVD
jgi:tRNA(fMet)-specific endonuclease VapC